jgi:hypothetical protein
MRIVLDLPDWVDGDERRIRILYGSELVARKNPWENFWLVKDDRCSRCGQCCLALAPNSQTTPAGVDDEGKCKALFDDRGEMSCAIFADMLSCFDDPIDDPECSITKRKVEVK